MRLAKVRVDASGNVDTPDNDRLPERTVLTQWSHQPELVPLHIRVNKCVIVASCKVLTDSHMHR